MDGARFANAVAFLDCHPADLTWRAGGGRAVVRRHPRTAPWPPRRVVFFNRDLVRDFELRRKRAGHLLSKSRYVAAQLLAYVESGVWKRNAQRSNRLAQGIGRAAGASLMPPGAGERSVREARGAASPGIAHRRLRVLRLGSGGRWRGALRGLVDQPEADVPALCAALGRL